MFSATVQFFGSADHQVQYDTKRQRELPLVGSLIGQGRTVPRQRLWYGGTVYQLCVVLQSPANIQLWATDATHSLHASIHEQT